VSRPRVRRAGQAGRVSGVESELGFALWSENQASRQAVAELKRRATQASDGSAAEEAGRATNERLLEE
jgi:hypothetical protein